jgi:UDP-N-acetylglucosamine 2-epimerase (non-hydrolysing)
VNCAVVLGTRPEIVKLAPVIWVLRTQGLDHVLIHTGQHFSYEMDKVFFELLDLPKPDLNLQAGKPGATHGVQTGEMLAGLEAAFEELGVDRIVCLGDTNTVLAAALTGAKMHLPVGHVEAGLRSYDRTMPEEVNRVVADHVSTQLFAPTRQAVANLAAEGITAGVTLTGNTIVDTVCRLSDHLREAATVRSHGLSPRGYVFATVHRQENTDDPARLAGVLDGLKRVAAATGLPLVLSLHHRTRARLLEYGLSAEMAGIPGLVLLFPPVGLLACLEFQLHARLVMTDSGGLQEEACILGTPCVTLRENTERPETLALGCNILAGYRPEGILRAAKAMLDCKPGWPNPFGDGKAALRCVAAACGRPDLDPGPLPAAVQGRAQRPVPGAGP